jgi:hypothetical protein
VHGQQRHKGRGAHGDQRLGGKDQRQAKEGQCDRNRAEQHVEEAQRQQAAVGDDKDRRGRQVEERRLIGFVAQRRNGQMARETGVDQSAQIVLVIVVGIQHR